MSERNQETELLFEELVKRYINLVYHIAYYWCNNRYDAEELVQETFLKAYTHFHSFSPGTNFKAWILKILHHLYIDSKRHQSSQPATVSLESLGELPVENTPASLSVLDLENEEIFYDLFSEELARLLKQLPKEYQLCLLLCDVEELSYQEIAEVLGCPVGTIRSRIHRGRTLLQSKIKDYAQKIGYWKEPKL